MKRLAILLALVACSEKKKPSSDVPAPAITCDAVGAAVQTTWNEKSRRAKVDVERVDLAKMGSSASKRLVDLCTDDRWSTDAVTCVVAAIEQKRAQELEAEEGIARPPGPDPLEKCLTADQLARLLGIPKTKPVPKFPEKK